MSNLYYEWDRETIDENGDVEDHEFADTLVGSGFALASFRDANTDLVLVRTDDGDRVWAYCTWVDGTLVLAECWNNGVTGLGDMPNWKVPKKFHNELAAWQRR